MGNKEKAVGPLAVSKSAVDGLVKCPPVAGRTRVETGPVQFGDDWPGVFIRGDNAYHFSAALYLLLGDIERGVSPSEICKGIAKDLARLLGQCRIQGT